MAAGIAMSKLRSFERYRPLLFSIAYRMLGSAMEAEDMVQEAFLRYQQGEAIQSDKAYLTTIVTRLCLDQLKSAKTQRENYVGTWLPEPLLTSESAAATVDRYESISMAFLVMLEKLSPAERAIFLLRDVFDYRYAEIARMVDKSEANCRRYYRRAKQFLRQQQPRFEPSPAEGKRLVESFLQAVATGDTAGLTDMLVEDVTFYGDGGGKAPAIRQPLSGREAVIRFLLVGVYRLLPADVHIEIAEVNGSPSALFWGQDRLYFVMHLTIADNRITTIRNILNPDKLGYIQQQRLAAGLNSVMESQ
jgi:RNA polymerase sigma-70 factor (ECF subfamily)